ncbi:MAG TPA: prepilin-type N-terminal cleavage/methylation domain-containing protein [Thermomonas sp.]|nr:prepilin-type N-terminal cleavage/methylation domain-containing protein [Thermomonas sp.]
MTAGRTRGFTLMEMLVTLMLVSFATMLMFQTLGSYRIARERVQGQSGLIDRQALFQDWFRDSVHGLFIAEGLQFSGERTRFRGTSLNPLFAPEGSPTLVQWTIEEDGERAAIAYAEDGVERWRVRLARADTAHFAYLDETGKESATWPPARGLQDARPSLPAVVVLSRTLGGREIIQTAAVLGPLKPPVRLYGEEELE